VAIRDELSRSQTESLKVPFLWIVTDRKDSLSTTVKQFFPPDQLHVVTGEFSDSSEAGTSEALISGTPSNLPTPAEDLWREMAQVIVEQIPVGKFKSTDCQGVIRKHWPQHSLASAGGPSFGIEFQKNIWPVLQERGVRIADPGKKPIRYEMTQDAKRVNP
jgi:hypothetical protein